MCPVTGFSRVPCKNCAAPALSAHTCRLSLLLHNLRISQFQESLLESRAKVSGALCDERESFVCMFGLVCVRDVWRGALGEHVWGRHGGDGPVEGYPNRAQNSPQAAPNIEEQLWPLLVTPWISHTVNIDFSH